MILFDFEDEISQLFKILDRTILKYANPDLCDSLIKLNYMFLRKATLFFKENSSKEKSNKYLSLIGNSFSLLLEWPILSDLKMKENYLNYFFYNSSLFSNLFFKENCDNTKLIFESQPLALPRMIFSWINLQQTYFKAKQVEFLNLFSGIFKTLAKYLTSNNLKNSFFYQGNTDRKTYILPLAIDFIINQYEVLVLPNPIAIKHIFVNLTNLLICFPENPNQLYMGEAIYYADYDSLLNKLIKMTIDSQDIDCKESLTKCLKILWTKTPMNFRIQIQAADYNKQHSRIELLSKIGSCFI